MKLLLAVTGSISAYKALDLTRKLTKEGHSVRVILSKGAEKFVVKETFSYLGCEKVYSHTDDFKPTEEGEGNVRHVFLSQWADKFIIAPLSANTLSDLVHAKANDLLTSTFLAWKKGKPILVFPAMNTEMLNHPFVSENLERLRTLSNCFVGGTQSGILACGDIGAGKLLPVDEIAALIYSTSLNKSGKSILLTTGATLAPLDDVRFLTNASTGKTALPLIEKALERGHTVQCIAGKFATQALENYIKHPCFELTRVVTTKEMSKEVHERFSSSDYYISSAAIGDFEFQTNSGKLKKAELSKMLTINKSQDILASVLKVKKDNQIVIGFAAESVLSDEVLTEKIQRKPVDLLIGTQVSSGLVDKQTQGFGTDQAQYRFAYPDGGITPPSQLTKEELSIKILNFLDKKQAIGIHETIQ